MKDSASDLSNLLDSLSQRHSRLGEDLIRVAEGLRGTGAPPDARLLEDLAEYRQDFTVLRLKALEYADGAGAEHGYELNELSTLDDLRLLMAAAAAADVRKKESEEIRRKALAVLEGVNALEHVGGTQFQPLEDRKAEARQLRRLLGDLADGGLPQEAIDLAESRHPLAALLALVEGGDALDDELWSHLQEVVEEAFGRPLAVAVSRGRLIQHGAPFGDSGATPHPVSGDNPHGGNGDVAQTTSSSVNTQEREFIQLPELAVDPPREDSSVSTKPGTDASTPAIATHAEQAVPEAHAERGVADREVLIDQTASRKVTLEEIAESEGKTTEPVPTDAEVVIRHGGENEEGHPGDVADGGRAGREVPVYGFAAAEDSTAIAAAVLGASAEGRAAALRDLVWRLLFEEKSSLAYHLARAVVEEGTCALQCLPPKVIRQAILGSRVRHASGDLAAVLKEDFAEFSENYFAGENSDWDHAVRFLLVASALRPALLAPGTGASTLLRSLRLKDGLDRLYAYCGVIADYGDNLQPLDTVSLKSAGNQGAWDVAARSLRAEAEEWFSRAPQKHIIYHQATRVWRSWLEPGELIESLLRPVLRDDPSRLQWVEEEVDRLTGDAIGREIDRTDRQKLGRRVGQDITARAGMQLRSNVREAVSFVRRWVELQKNRPGPARGFLQQQAEALRGEVRSRQAGVLAELDAFAERNRSLYVRTAIAYCRRAVEDILTLFDPEVELPREEPPADLLLNADLLRLPSARLGEDWGVAEAPPAPALIDETLRFLRDGIWDWRATFEARSEARDHEGTLRVIELLEASGTDTAALEDLKGERESRLADCRAALARDVEDTRRHLGDAVAFGLLREQEHSDLAAEILSVERALADTLLFRAAHARLNAVRERLAHKKEEEREVVRQRLGGLEERLRSAPDALERIRAALDKGDVHTANEYIEMTLAGLPLPDPAPQADTFTAFFPQTLKQIFDFLEQSGGSAFNPVTAVNEIRRYAAGQRRSYTLGPVDMDRVPGSQARQAADLLQAWFTAKRAHAIEAAGARIILDNLGLNTTGASVRKQGRRTWIDVEADTVRDRNRCPVPQYGSMALGRYRVLCVWERPSEEDMLSDVADSSHGRPVILFYFGRMTEPRRRELARLCRERRRTFVVIDDALVSYLCGVAGSRLRVMFDCALPFTFLEPYTTTAGLVPPEMFYGRERERDSVGDLMGSCFIYGGRQLGKTALLRDVERTFHAPERGRVALWLDLKSHGIGYDRPVDDLWSILAGEFKRLGVLPSTVPAHVGVDKLLDHVQAWVAADNDRRILLLLDESDRFLDYDGREGEGPDGTRGFVRAARLKGLMDRTNRRFKVVFAGLHNVQRTTRLANHPLAHYGEPICIGPLLDNGEWRAARDLVEKPLASLGYVFESPDLVTRILSQTNYYPSLIQLYCSHLLRHVTARGANSFDPKACPPYVITSRHVEEAYLSQDLRKAIRDRFIWTLQLDQRYEVIAYTIAHGTLSDDRGVVDGFDVEWIKRQAIEWWPEGFREGSTDVDFETLLDEMVGLGILRLVSAHRYALRSANIVLLMGTVEEIENALLVSREPPLDYEPAAFRSALRSGDSVDPGRRNPLTAGQESELRIRANGVHIIFGTEAAGLGSLRSFLRPAFGEDYFVHMDGVTEKAEFDKRLAELGSRERGGTTLVFVPASCPWGEAWVGDALERVSRLRSKTSFVRVVFVADPATTWRLTTQPDAALSGLIERGVGHLTLRQWHDAALRQWADDLGLPADKEGRDRIAEATGRWQAAIERFHDAAHADLPRWERKLAEFIDELKNPTAARDFSRLFGLDHPEGARILGDLQAVGDATAEELAGVIEGHAEETVFGCLRWAELLNLTTQVGGGRWRVDPFVGRLLEVAGG